MAAEPQPADRPQIGPRADTPARPVPVAGRVMPTDVKLVITALLVVLAVAGLIIQVLTSSVLIGVLVGLAGAFFVSAFIWMTRL